MGSKYPQFPSNSIILITSSVGFIDSNLEQGFHENEESLNIVGLNSLNGQYDPSLKVQSWIL